MASSLFRFWICLLTTKFKGICNNINNNYHIIRIPTCRGIRLIQ